MTKSFVGVNEVQAHSLPTTFTFLKMLMKQIKEEHTAMEVVHQLLPRMANITMEPTELTDINTERTETTAPTDQDDYTDFRDRNWGQLSNCVWCKMVCVPG